jgi:hypothetical protein
MSFHTCSATTVCIYNTDFDYDGQYISGGTFNGNTYYTGGTVPTYYIYFNTGLTENLWCLSSSLGGICEQFGTLNSFSICPDFWEDIYLEGGCPATTTTTTSPCNVFDFAAIFDCLVPTTTTTTTSATTTTTTTTILPDLCSGVSISFSSITYTTTTTTIAPTTTTTTTIDRPCVFGGLANFNIFDEFMRCGNSKHFKDCFNGFDYYSSEIIEFSEPLVQDTVYEISIDGFETCATFMGLVDNVSGVDEITVISKVGLSIDGACLECVPPQTTTTTTSTSTTTTTTTEPPCELFEYNLNNPDADIPRKYSYTDCAGETINGVLGGSSGELAGSVITNITICSNTVPIFQEGIQLTGPLDPCV